MGENTVGFRSVTKYKRVYCAKYTKGEKKGYDSNIVNTSSQVITSVIVSMTRVIIIVKKTSIFYRNY